MARVALTPADIIRTGVTYALTDANTDGVSVNNNGLMFIAVQNANTATTVTITVDNPSTIDGLGVSELVVEVAGENPGPAVRLIGPFTARFNQPGTTNVHVDADTVSNVSWAAFRLS